MKNIRTIILAISASLCMVSCEGFLEKGPILQQSTELTLSTYSGLSSATMGAYSYLASTTWYGGDRILESEMRSGNGIKALAHTSNRYMTEYNWNYTSDATSSLWAYGYYTIARCNNVIDNLEGKEEPGVVSTQDLNNLKAECLFIRALAHLDMVLLYAQPYTYKKDGLGVPVVLHTEPDARPARNTVAEVYAQVEADLLEAEKIISPSYTHPGVADKKASVSLDAIRALLSRVYLYMGKWNECAEYATKVIDNKNYKLWTADEYADVWTNEVGGSEVIFEVYIDISNNSNENPSYMTYPEGAYGDCLTSLDLYNSYDEGDVRLDCFIQDSKGNEGLYWTTKYAGKGITTPDANNTVVLRLSEMYLNRAEATVNGAKSSASAVSDLNAITSNRGASAYTSVGMADIRAERRKELAWEGHYFFDLARWNQPCNREANSFLQDKNRNIPFPDYRWALPIPKRELEVNESLIQNDNY